MAINILDQLKKLITRNDPAGNLSPTVASFSGIANALNALPNPDPILKKAGKDIQVYRDLLSDDEVWSAWQSFKSGVKSLEWELWGDETNEERISALDNLFRSYKMYNLIDQILDARGFGFQPIEVTWQRDANGWIPTKLTPKPPEWFEFDREGFLCVKKEYNQLGNTTERVPELSYIVAQHGASYANPYGQAVLSRVFWPATFKKGGIKFWVVFMEKYGLPWVTGKLPRSASNQERTTLLDQLSAMVQDAVGVIPDDSTVEVHQTGTTSSGDLHPTFIDFFVRQINKVILSQTLTGTSGDGSGSYSLGKVHFEIREDVVAEGKRLVEEVMNQIIEWIYRFNYGSKPLLQFRMYEEKDVDQALAERDATLTRSGVKFSKKYFKRVYGLEDDDFEIIETTELPPWQGMPGFSHRAGTCSCGCAGQTAVFENEHQSQNLIQSALDAAAQTVPAESAIKGALQPILGLFNGLDMNQSPDSFFAALAEQYPQMNAKELEDTLARIIFASEILGRISSEQERE